MAHSIELRFAARTDTGMLRPQNEDAIALSPEFGVAILADGMGGYNAGEIASGIATATVKESLEQALPHFDWNENSGQDGGLRKILVDAVERANLRILETARDQQQYKGMGTTIVVALFHDDAVLVAHVGDSRLYRLRQEKLTVITRDHSLLQEQIDAGLIDAEQARLSPNRNLITRAVGVDRNLEVEIHEHQTRPGDLYLLCSDGLHDMLAEQEIEETVKRMGPDLEVACDALVQIANDHGGRDNISVILVELAAAGAQPEGLVRRLANWLKA